MGYVMLKPDSYVLNLKPYDPQASNHPFFNGFCLRIRIVFLMHRAGFLNQGSALESGLVCQGFRIWDKTHLIRVLSTRASIISICWGIFVDYAIPGLPKQCRHFLNPSISRFQTGSPLRRDAATKSDGES